MDPTQYFENRLRVLALLKVAGENPYPHKFEVSISVVDYVKQYGGLSDADHLKDVEVNLAGRIMSKQTSSSKLYFYDIYGGGAKVQGYNSLKDYFPTMEMKPNPQCSNSACLECQKEYAQAKPARDAIAMAKMEAEASVSNEGPLHDENVWNISVVDDSEVTSAASKSSDALPEGLVHELPSADKLQESPLVEETSIIIDDLGDLQRQLDALNAT